MLASAFLAILAAAERTRQPPPDDMIPLTSSEIHHLLNVLPDQRPQHRTPPALVHMAAAAPAPRQDQPLPTTSTNMKITRRSSLGCPVQLRSD
jgi:hypothetical protein